MSRTGFLPTHISENCVTGLALVPTVFFVSGSEEPISDPVSCGTSIHDRIERLEKTPRRAQALTRARKRLGELLSAEQHEGSTPAALRLRAGLSQKQLAELLGTQQSNVSRMERIPGDPQLTTLRKWAHALGVSIDELTASIAATAEGRSE